MIPARGGSEGVHRKNVRHVAGMPLIAWTILAAQDSRLINEIAVSTDDPEISTVAGRYGALVWQRPESLSRGEPGSIIRVLTHLVPYVERDYKPYDLIVLLQPTSPIRTGRDIDNVISLFADADVDSVISVYQVEDAHPSHMYTMAADNELVPLPFGTEISRRQELSPVYHRNGAIYAARRSLVMDNGTLMGGRRIAYVMPREHSINIDSEYDLRLADTAVREWKERLLE